MKKKQKNMKGIRQPNLNGSLTRPLSDESERNALRSTLSGLEYMQPAKTLSIESAVTAASVTREDHSQVA